MARTAKLGVRRGAALGLAALLSAGCNADEAPPNDIGTPIYAGYYRQGFEQSDFYPTSGGGPYWLTADEEVWTQIQDHYVSAPGRGGAVTVRLVVEGRLDAGGDFGHVGAYEYELVAQRILEIEPLTAEEFNAWLTKRPSPEGP